MPFAGPSLFGPAIGILPAAPCAAVVAAPALSLVLVPILSAGPPGRPG